MSMLTIGKKSNVSVLLKDALHENNKQKPLTSTFPPCNNMDYISKQTPHYPNSGNKQSICQLNSPLDWRCTRICFKKTVYHRSIGNCLWVGTLAIQKCTSITHCTFRSVLCSSGKDTLVPSPLHKVSGHTHKNRSKHWFSIYVYLLTFFFFFLLFPMNYNHFLSPIRFSQQGVAAVWQKNNNTLYISNPVGNSP